MDVSANPDDDNAAPEQERAPIEISKFWVTRSGEALITQITFFRGKPFLDCRRHYTDKAGKLAPTKKGFTISLRKLPELAKAVSKAEAEAKAHGLIGGDE